MTKKGTVLVVGIGSEAYDLINFRERFWEEEGFNSSLVAPEAVLLADCRNSQSKSNKLFTYRVQEARNKGLNVVLIVPRVDMVDKRLRESATLLQLERSSNEQ